jgi:hypothetical protein
MANSYFKGPPQRVEIVDAGTPWGGMYFKRGQYGFVLGMNTTGGMHCIDKAGPSKSGEIAYLVSKTREMKGGALWFSKDAVRFATRKKG